MLAMGSTNGGDNVDNDLHKAVKSKNIAKVRKVLDTGGHIYINLLNKESKSPLHIAIEEDLNEIVELFLSIQEEQIANEQYLLICHAISKGNIEMVKLLAGRYFRKDRFEQNMKAFGLAAKETKFDILNYLLGLLLDCDTNSNNYTASVLLYFAIFCGHIVLVKKILVTDVLLNESFKPSPDGCFISSNHAGYSPLHLSVECLQVDVVKLLLDAGADTSKQNQQNSTALHIAFGAKVKGIWKTWQDFETNNKIIDMLLDVDLGKNAKLINKNGITHLHAICSRDQPEFLVKFLQENSISKKDLEIRDNTGFSCLHYAARYRCCKVAKILLQTGVNVNQQDNRHCTPIHIATKQKSLEIVQLLMQFGADLILRDCDGCTPIHVAFRERHYAILDLLLTSPNITHYNSSDAEGVTFFHIACSRNNVNLVEAYISRGVCVNLVVPSFRPFDLENMYYKNVDWQGCTPLHFATVFNRLEVVKLLLSNGADVHRKEMKGLSAIHLACQQSYNRFGDLFEKTLQKWKNDNSIEELEMMEDRPYADVITVEEEKEVDSYPRRFPNISSQLSIVLDEKMDIFIHWESNIKDQNNIISLLIENGADINALDNFENAPLYYICDFNIHKILDILHKKFHLKKKFGSLMVKQLLIESYGRRQYLLDNIFLIGVRINVNKSYNNKSILYYICQSNEFFDREKNKMIKYFLDKNADPDTKDNLLGTPLHVAIKNSTECEIIRTGQGIHGNTPLQISLDYSPETLEYEQMIKTLLEYTANVDSRDAIGQTPLFVACITKKYNLMNILLRHGADVNIVDNNGQTAIYYFYKKNLKNFVREMAGFINRIILNMPANIYMMTRTLVQHVMKLEELGLHISEQVENPTLQIKRFLTGTFNESDFRSNLRKQVDILKTIEVNDRYSLYYILFMNERSLSKSVIIEQLDKLLTSKESYLDMVPSYVDLVNHKRDIAVRRRRFLSEAKETLNRLLSSNFPEICSDLIFMELSSLEVACFVRAFAGYL